MSQGEKEKIQVCVVGSGVAGLAAGRRLVEYGNYFTPVIFEQGPSLGGTWRYTPETPAHSSAYKNLRTNLPKEVMTYPDFGHKVQGISYLSSSQVLQYLEAYSQHYNIASYIKYNHKVKHIRPMKDQWEVQVLDLIHHNELTCQFDAVMICNGHNTVPKYPKIKGLQYFKGYQMHSHDYREPAIFAGKSVLLIGGGPSGLDLTFELAAVTHKVILSHHTDYADKLSFPKNVILKPDIKKILENGSVLFQDDTDCEIDVILHCTGYLYTLPFLSEECCLMIEDNYISPLYKHCLNINRPTMALIGFVRHTPIFYVADFQVQFFLHLLKNKNRLPSKDNMLRELDSDIQKKMKNGLKKCDYHVLGTESEDYISQLSQISGVAPMPAILLRMYFHGYDRIFSDFSNFRHKYYDIIDDDNFSVADLRSIQAKSVPRLCREPQISKITERKL